MSESATSSSNSRWEAYGDYKSVSQRVGQSIDSALEAYAGIQSMHQENARIDGAEAAQARARILSAALRLVPELEYDDDEYEEILSRWMTDDDVDQTMDDDDLGYIRRLNRVQLRDECPGWLYQFVLDIRRAGWQLGYLQAGREVREEPENIVERDTEQMFN